MFERQVEDPIMSDQYLVFSTSCLRFSFPVIFTSNRMVATCKKKVFLPLQSFGHFGVLLMLQNRAKFRTVMSRWFDVPPFAVGASSGPWKQLQHFKKGVWCSYLDAAPSPSSSVPPFLFLFSFSVILKTLRAPAWRKCWERENKNNDGGPE